MNKCKFYTELAYAIGLTSLAAGIALLEAVDFGVSMEGAPPYLIYLSLSQIIPSFSFGMSELIWQVLLALVMILVVRKIKLSYLFSVVTAVIYAVLLDSFMKVIQYLPVHDGGGRILGFFAAMLLCQLGIALMFHTYITPLVYELFVQEIAAYKKRDLFIFKSVFDCVSCVLGIGLSFLFFGFGEFRGVKLGTIFCAVMNGWMIGRFSRYFEKHLAFVDGFHRKASITMNK